MIQPAPIKPIEIKAAPAPKVSSTTVKSSAPSAQKQQVSESKGEDNEFAQELEAASSDSKEVKNETPAKDVLKAEVSAEENKSGKPEVKIENVDATALLMSTPAAVVEGESQEVAPSTFDPALTKGVEKLINPQAEVSTQAPIELTQEQVLKIAEGQVEEVKAEVAKTLAKNTPVTKEAVVTVKTSQEPQLMNLDDFVATKNAIKKPQVQQNAYGMVKPTMAQKEAAVAGLATTQMVKELPLAGEVKNEAINSQQFILNMMSEQNGTPRANEVAGAQKTLDLSQIKTQDSNGIMNQISDYIVQAKAAKEPTVNLRFNHEQLGIIDITVSKATQPGVDAVAINIGAHSVEGRSFFQTNSKDLFSHLNQAGVSVSDLKVERSFESQKNDFDMNHQGRQGSGDKQYASEQNQRRNEQDRRRELWELLNSEAA